MQSKSRPTWAIKRNNLMWDFLSGPQRDEIHVFNLFAVVSNNTISPATTEIGIQQSVRDLIFLRVWGEANYTYFLRDRRQQQTIRCDIYIFISYVQQANHSHLCTGGSDFLHVVPDCLGRDPSTNLDCVWQILQCKHG